VLTVASIFSKISGMLQAMEPHHAEGHRTVLIASIGALIVGSSLGFLLYRGKDSDPLASNKLAKVFANKFYFDEFYAVLVKVFQDGLAWVITGIERIFVDGIVARLPAFAARRFGAAARSLTGGHLQGYTFLLGVGLLVVIYLLVFVLPQAGH
jgi:NADH-quinone oxidoreductase subunit L